MKRQLPILVLALSMALAHAPCEAQTASHSAIAAVPVSDDVTAGTPRTPGEAVDEDWIAPTRPARHNKLSRRFMEGIEGLESMVADRRPMERLRSEISLYHEARGIADPRRRTAMLEELDSRPAHREARAAVVRMLRKADAKPNPMYQMRLVQTGMAWLLEVDGISTAAVPELDALRSLPARRRQGTPEMDRVLRRLASLVEQAQRTRQSAAGPRPAAGRPAAAGPHPTAADVGTRGARGLFSLLVLLATLALGLHLGARRAAAPALPAAQANAPVHPGDTPDPGQPALPAPAPAPALPASQAPPALAGTSEPAAPRGPGDAFLPVLRDAMEIYVARIHRVKNQLGIAARFEGDPDGLVANLFEPENYRELGAFLERSRAELARLASRVSGAPDLPAGFSTLLSRGERVLAGALDTLKRLEAEHRAGTSPDLPPRVEEEVGRLAREVRTWSSDLCQISDRHAFTPRDLVEEVVGRTAYRDAVAIRTSEGFPASLLVPDAERARTSLAGALGNLLDNAHQAGARRISVQLGWVHITSSMGAAGGELTLSVGDDGPGVPASLRDRLFNPRFTTREDGTGMGLFGARKALQELGGDAGHVAPPQGGAQFWLKVPALAA